MKCIKILSVILLCFNAKICLAQLPPSGSNLSRPDLDKFVGTWVWVNGNDKVTIQLKKINYFFSNRYHEEIIVGSHQYIKNGNIQENYLPEFSSITQSNTSTLFLYEDADLTFPNKISGGLYDHQKNKTESLGLEYIAGSTPILIWHLQVRGDVIVQPMIEGLTLPEDIILTQQ